MAQPHPEMSREPNAASGAEMGAAVDLHSATGSHLKLVAAPDTDVAPTASPAAHVDAIRAIMDLHQVITLPDGRTYCAHCCLNRIGERKFSCFDTHDHERLAACPTRAELVRFGVLIEQIANPVGRW